MKIAVLGCGAIGGLFLGYLSQKKYDVFGVAKDYQAQCLVKDNLIIEGVRGGHKVKVNVVTKLQEKPDLAILATKINDLEAVIKNNLEFLKTSIVVSTQNGTAADYILGKYFDQEKIITSVVMFGATFYSPNKVVHNFEGDLVVGNIFGKSIPNRNEVETILQTVTKISWSANIKGSKYLKIFLNLNNCLPAILGISLQEAFMDLEIARLAIRLNQEAYNVVNKSGITLEDLPTYPKGRLVGLVSMDIKSSAMLFSKIMTSLSKEPLYGSILQSIKRQRQSEIDYVNGEIIRLAARNNLSAPLNDKVIKLVHQVEETGKFLTKKGLLEEIQDFAAY